MKQLFILINMLIICFCLFSNDGGYYPSAEIYPINIENISLKYERLIFTKINEKVLVDAELHFEYLGSESKNVLLGFEYPQSTMGKNYSEKTLVAQILLVNGQPVKYEHTQDENRGISILIYDAIFNYGENIIYHRYEISPGFGEDRGHFEYILKTGARWKDSKINEIEIYFINFTGMSFTQDSMSDFNIIGYAKQLNNFYIIEGGFLYAHIYNLVPTKNIDFYSGFSSESSVYSYFYKSSESQPPKLHDYLIEDDFQREYYLTFIGTCLKAIENPEEFEMYDPKWKKTMYESLEKLSKDKLRILRNTVYAKKGYSFTDKYLIEYFNKQIWYFFNPNILNNSINLLPAEKEFISIVSSIEATKK